jgi:1,2-phenylacetyl-CoA epoxidase catalytic subunit
MTGTSDGKILKEFSGENLASGALLEKKVITSWLDFGSMFTKKQLEKFYVLADINNQVTMQVTVKQDWNRQAVQSFPVVQPVAKDVYGTGTYGTATYSGSNILDHSESIEGKFRSIQLDFDLSASDTSMKLLGYGFDVKVLDANSP